MKRYAKPKFCGPAKYLLEVPHSGPKSTRRRSSLVSKPGRGLSYFMGAAHRMALQEKAIEKAIHRHRLMP